MNVVSFESSYLWQGSILDSLSQSMHEGALHLTKMTFYASVQFFFLIREFIDLFTTDHV